MKRKSKHLVLLLAVWLCFGEVANAQGYSLSFDGFMRSVKTRHPVSVKAGNLAAIGNAGARAAKGAFDPQLGAGLDNKFFSGTNYYNTAIAEVKQGLYTGQTIKAGLEYGGGNFVNPEETTKGAVLPYVGIELSLLQGLVIDKRRYEVLKGERYKKLLETEGVLVLNELLHDAAAGYTEWLRDLALTEINKRYIETATQRFDALKSLSAIGERPTIDTVEAAILIQSRLVDYGYARMALTKTQNQLSYYMLGADSVLPAADFATSDNIRALEELCLSRFLKMETFDINTNPGLLYYGYKNSLLQLERRYKAEMVKPKLDLRYNLLGSTQAGGTFYTNNYKWGAGFSMPLFLRNPVNELKIARLNLRNNEMERQTKSAELTTKINAIKVILRTLADQIQIAKQTLNYSRLLLDAERIKFDNNESSLFLLNTREGKVLDSEIKLVELQGKFVDTFFTMVYLEGTLNYQLN